MKMIRQQLPLLAVVVLLFSLAVHGAEPLAQAYVVVHKGCDLKFPYNNHDSNVITLHRVKRFRSQALNPKPDFDATAASDELKREKDKENLSD